MRKFVLLLFFMTTVLRIMAGDLVLIRSSSHGEVSSLANDGQMTINHLGTGFVIATLHGATSREYTLIERNSWVKGSRYYLLTIPEASNRKYRKLLNSATTVLYSDPDLAIIRVSELQMPDFLPPDNGSMILLKNLAVNLPPEQQDLRAPRAADPFIIARMAEVNTTLMQANIQHLQNYGTRNAYSTQAVLAQNWIKSQFEGYGLSVSLFDFTMPSGSASDNVIATKTGALYPNEYVIIGGHYDSYSSGATAPGADDNATGTCGVLEVARILSSHTFDRTIIFCAFSGEEYGLYGSEAYAAWCDAENLNILGYMNMDMIGYLKAGDPIHTDMIAPSSAQSLVDFYTAVTGIYLPDFPVTPGTLTGGDSDHTSFNDHGFKGIFPFEDSQYYSPYIHSVNDVMGTSVNNMEQVGIFTKAMIAATISLANLDPPQIVSVSGLVTDLTTGLPINGATVQLVNTTVTPGVSNTSGHYSMSGITTGFYTIRASKSGYATVTQMIQITSTDTVYHFQLETSPAWSFESGIFDPSWTFGGNLPWTIINSGAYDGTYCAKSGAIGHSQSSEMSIQLFLTSPGTVSFNRKVSSESGYDYLKFFIDNVQQGQWSGTIAWGEVNFSATAGLHTFKWTYSKDDNTVGGSDCAYVDYIIFPPYGPIPGPPDITVTPITLSRTVGLEGVADEVLLVSNIGDQDLIHTTTVVYSGGGTYTITLYPVSAASNTGSTTVSAKTQTSLVKGYAPSEAGWMKFDLSPIPDGATINSVEFHGYVNATYFPYWNINPVGVDPVSASASTLYADITAETSGGYYLYRSETSSYAAGWKVHTLGGTANADLQSCLVKNWFAIGIMDRDGSATYYIGFDGWNEANKPYLVVNYAYNPPFSWLTLNGASSVSGTILPAGSQQLTAGFSAGSLAAGSYSANIRIVSNDPDEDTVLIPCSLTVTTDRNLAVTLFPEGLYEGNGALRKAQDANGSQFTGSTADKIGISLHDASDYDIIRFSNPDVSLNTAGAAILLVPSPFNGNYYLTVNHRNSLETTSSSPVSFTGNTIAYAFDSPGKAFGNNLQESADGRYLLYGGDFSQDGFVNTDDLTAVDNDVSVFAGGYLPSDINGDGFVDTADMTIIDNNAGAFVASILP